MAESRKKILFIEDDRETVELIVEELADRGSEADTMALSQFSSTGRI
jgi:DNA-binding response OmpR family regulator